MTVETLEKDLTLREIARPGKKVPEMKDVIGRAVPRIGTYGQLDNKQQVVALIDEVYIR